MVGIFRKLSEKFSNKMLAPGAEDPYDYYDDYENGYDYDDYESYQDEPEPIHLSQGRGGHASRKNASRSTASSTRSTARSSGRDNVYGFTPASSSNQAPQAETLVMHPKSMEDAVEIGSHVRSGRMCIVDLTDVPTTEAQRIADYLCGNCDALDGSITRINNTIIAASPRNHRVMPDYRGGNPFDEGFFSKASSDR
ncbi:MAG: cell division protein SepF [Defluviitaleaceae bacterium]|nr:cell division protein SepF [Defluviitaleaceae bacterium]